MFKDYFYGNKISDYGRKYGRVDYATLAKAFDAVLNNEIMGATWELGEWEQESGFIDNSDEIEELEDKITDIEAEIVELNEQGEALEDEGKDAEASELYMQAEALGDKRDKLEEEKDELEWEQDEQPEIFQYYIVSDEGARILEEFGEIVYYHENLDMYLWGVTHYGTSWSYVLTDIPCEKDETAHA